MNKYNNVTIKLLLVNIYEIKKPYTLLFSIYTQWNYIYYFVIDYIDITKQYIFTVTNC